MIEKGRTALLIGAAAHIQDGFVVAPPPATVDSKRSHAIGAHVTEGHGGGSLLHS
jgi:hypothetical protein